MSLSNAVSLRVSTWLTLQEAITVSAIPNLSSRMVHRPSLTMIHNDLRSGISDTVVISAARAQPRHRAHIAALVADFPHNTIVGVTTPVHTQPSTSGVFLLGKSGVQDLVDVTQVGWAGLGKAIGSDRVADPFASDPFWLQTKLTLRARIEYPTVDYDRFLSVLFDPRSLSVSKLAKKLGLSMSCLISRFQRANLPSPKSYFIQARLVSAARLAETPARSCADVARCLHASSPQSWDRTVRLFAGCSFSDFRQQYTGDSRLDYFCAHFIDPYLSVLKHFDRLTHPVLGGRSTH